MSEMHTFIFILQELHFFSLTFHFSEFNILFQLFIPVFLVFFLKFFAGHAGKACAHEFALKISKVLKSNSIILFAIKMSRTDYSKWDKIEVS